MRNIIEFVVDINRLLMSMPIGYKVAMYSMEEISGVIQNVPFHVCVYNITFHNILYKYIINTLIEKVSHDHLKKLKE